MQIKVKPLETKESEVVLVEDNQRVALAFRDYELYKMTHNYHYKTANPKREYINRMFCLSPGEIYQLSSMIRNSIEDAFFLNAILLRSYQANPNNDFILKNVPNCFGQDFAGTKEHPIKLTIDEKVEGNNIFHGSKHILCELKEGSYASISDVEDSFFRINGDAGIMRYFKRSFVIVDGDLADECCHSFEDSIVFARNVERDFARRSINSIFILDGNAVDGLGEASIRSYFSVDNAGSTIGYKSKDCEFHVNTFQGAPQDTNSNFIVNDIDPIQARFCVIKTENKKLYDLLSVWLHKELYLLDANGKVLDKC